jgi:hypothetical protein
LRTPPDIQVSSILYYLGYALRQDDEIVKQTGARPEEIVAQTVEYQPIDRGPGNKLHLYVSQLPSLCLNIDSERHRGVPGTGVNGKPPRGREFNATLWYVFQPFQSYDEDIHGFTKGQRYCSLMWWRIKHWLSVQQLPGIGTGPVFDFQAVSGIRTLELDGSSDRFAFDSVEGIKIPLKVWHGVTPYEEADPTILELISLGITSEAGSGVGVDADVDV